MNGKDETKGKEGPYVVGNGVVMTPLGFQSGIDCTGKNIESSVREGTELESTLFAVNVTGKKPYVALKKTIVDGREVVVGGEYGWKDDSEIVTERGVFDVFEGKLYSYLFACDVREKMVGILSDLYKLVNGEA